MLSRTQHAAGTARRSAAGWPITVLYLGASITAIYMAKGEISVLSGLIMITLIAVVMLIIGVSREIKTVHHLVNSQRDELLARIDQLVSILTEAGISIPRATENGGDR